MCGCWCALVGNLIYFNVLFLNLCVCFSSRTRHLRMGVFPLRTDEGPCVFFPASDCPWHIHKRISTHLTACICAYRVDVYVCVHAYVCVHLCSCFLRINNAIQPYYESTEQTDTDWMQRTRSQTKHAQKLCLWINVHTQDNMSESEFLGQDGYAWPQSLHVECAVGRRGGRTPTAQHTPEKLPQ